MMEVLKRLVVVLFVAISIVAVNGQGKSDAGQMTLLQTVDAGDTPTKIVRGRATEAVKAYSKEYRALYKYRTARKIGDMIASASAKTKDAEIGVSIGLLDFVSIDEKPVSTEQFIQIRACKSDLVVLGSIKSKTSHLMDDETFVFTEYDFAVKSVEKNNPKAPVKNGGVVQITRPGGFIELDERRVRAEDASYEALEPGREYLLFLRYVASANGYVVAAVDGDFKESDGQFRTLSKIGAPADLFKTEIQTLRDAIRGATCKKD